MSTTIQKAKAARELFLQQSFGVLSTMSIDVPGYPFGSVAPYCADAQSRPVIYISQIAQHTRNILADSRLSLTVVDNNADSDDVQARGRVTLIANALPVAPLAASKSDQQIELPLAGLAPGEYIVEVKAAGEGDVKQLVGFRVTG